ncbi:MAG: ribonuclease PH [Actinobacteria bacterium QS_5_72_10]|nr:MAG: ribonuclease PH [Actinobacteria bacterium QS_5_72_10]
MSSPTTDSARPDGRAPDQLRPVTIETGVQAYAEGSALITAGGTRVLCAASVADDVPPWLRDSGTGWVTAEYAMLPRATHDRTPRESARGRIKGRTHEIQRLIGRSLRAAVDLEGLGAHAITVDCDVLQADGGTRTAAITGGWVALADAVDAMVGEGRLASAPALQPVTAISVGLVDGQARLDLAYVEDAAAAVDKGCSQLDQIQAGARGRR